MMSNYILPPQQNFVDKLYLCKCNPPQRCVTRRIENDGPNKGRVIICCPDIDPVKKTMGCQFAIVSDSLNQTINIDDNKKNDEVNNKKRKHDKTFNKEQTGDISSKKKPKHIMDPKINEISSDMIIYQDDNTQQSQEVQCYHKLPAHLSTSRKPNQNQGRQFYGCSIPYGDPKNCGFFKWADQVKDTNDQKLINEHTRLLTKPESRVVIINSIGILPNQEDLVSNRTDKQMLQRFINKHHNDKWLVKQPTPHEILHLHRSACLINNQSKNKYEVIKHWLHLERCLPVEAFSFLSLENSSPEDTSCHFAPIQIYGFRTYNRGWLQDGDVDFIVFELCYLSDESTKKKQKKNILFNDESENNTDISTTEYNYVFMWRTKLWQYVEENVVNLEEPYKYNIGSSNNNNNNNNNDVSEKQHKIVPISFDKETHSTIKGVVYGYYGRNDQIVVLNLDPLHILHLKQLGIIWDP